MIKNLCGIRTFLFLLILATHYKYVIVYSDLGKSLFHYMDYGRTVLMSFFLLSGFCTAIGYADKFKIFNKTDYFSYIKSRFFKYYPLYLITGIVSFILFYLPQGIEWMYSFLGSYVTMLFPWLGLQSGGNGVGWFLCALFFCYLVTPFLLVYINKFKDLKSHILFMSVNYAILGAFSLTLAYFNDVANEFWFRFPIIRVFEYAIALDFGYIFVKYIKDKFQFKILNNFWIKSLLDVMFICIMLYCMYGFPNSLVYRHFFSMPLILMFFLYLCNSGNSILAWILSNRPVLYVGSISFECYMIHPLVIDFLKPSYDYYIYSIEGIITFFVYILMLTVLFSIVYRCLQDFIVNIINNKKLL